MDFAISEAVSRVCDEMGRFIDCEVVPLERAFLCLPLSELEPELDRVRARAKALGLWAPQLPKALGGMGLGLVELALVGERLGRSPLGHFAVNAQAPDAGNLELLQAFATDAQKERWLLPLARGEVRSCFAMTEPDFPGSNPVWMGTTAASDGDGYVINGRKWFTSAADGATFTVVMAVTDPGAEPHRRASLLIVPTDTPGYRRVRNIPCMGHTGQGWASHAELVFENCRISRENLIGEPGTGFALAQARLGPGRVHHCMRWLGICDRAFEMMAARAATRALAPGDPLGSRQTVQNWVAESRAEIDAARLLVLRAAWRLETLGTASAEGREAIALLKFHVAGVLDNVLDRAVQVHGALGISDDTVLSWFYRQERAARIYDGPDEVHKAAAAKRILKRYGMHAE
jgi:alkylation response protein AidB-like acyl-CoA dehydrogenase